MVKQESLEIGENDDHEYTVEKVLKSRIVNGQKQVLIKWEGYSAVYNTWEPAENIHTVPVEKAIPQTKRGCKSIASETNEQKENLKSKQEKQENRSFNSRTPKRLKQLGTATAADNIHQNSFTKTKQTKRERRSLCDESEKFLRRVSLNLRPPKRFKPDVPAPQTNPVKLGDVYNPPEIEKIIGKRTKANSQTEYLLTFKGTKKQIWEPSENKDIQQFIAEYEACLDQSRIKTQTNTEKLEANKQPSTELSTPIVEDCFQETNMMMKINIEIFRNDDQLMFKSGDDQLVQLNINALDKRGFCKAILNIMPSIKLKK